jgi:shikimate kinase
MESIFLIGPRHCGKTSAGRALAALCSIPFIDLDELIAERGGKSPRALYAEGPEFFRKAEAEALASVFEPKTPALCVVAMGGGITDNSAAIALLKKNKTALPVYLEITPKLAWERISRAGELPPFLKTENPRETHRMLHERRAAACLRLARLVIQAEGKSPGAIADEIAAAVFQEGYIPRFSGA